MAKCAALAIAILMTVTSALAQEPGRWTNPRLKDQGIAGEQYQAIGRGHLAERRARATQVSQQTFPPVSIPTNPFWEEAERARRDKQRQAMAFDLFNGCMAEKGWLFERP